MNSELINAYRLLDRDAALFSDYIRNNRANEIEFFIPEISGMPADNERIGRLFLRLEKLDAPNKVFALLKSHLTDFLNGEKARLEGMYTRPALSLSVFTDSFNFISRKDSRPDDVKAEILLAQFSRAKKLWDGLKGWLNQASPVFLQEAADSCRLFTSTMKIEKTQFESYFPALPQRRIRELIQATDHLSEMMTQWITEIYEFAAFGKNLSPDSTGDADIILFDEDYYRDLLNRQLGVKLDELIMWHEEEIAKTRENVFETMSRIRVSEPQPADMRQINEILLKYAGPCDTPKEMFDRARSYLVRTRTACRNYLKLPNEECIIREIPEYLKDNHPWGGYGGGDPKRRPLKGEMFLNQYNFKAITDGWIKINTIHEAYPGHHVQFVRHSTDPILESLRIGAKATPIIEGFAHRSETLFQDIFSEDPFFPLFVAYRRHHTAVRIKADLMLRYFGRPVSEAVRLYENELGFDLATARGQVKAHEFMPGYFTTYYYGLKKLLQLEKNHGFKEKAYTELILSAGRMSLENFECFISLSEDEQKQFFIGRSPKQEWTISADMI